MARPKLDQPNCRLVVRGDRLYVRWWQDGRWHRVSTGTADRREAARFLSQFAAGLASPVPPATITIGKVLDGYLADRRGQVASIATLEAACNALRRHLGDLEVTSIMPERGRFYARQRRAEGHMVGPAGAKRKKPTSDGTILREIVTLRAALRWAENERWYEKAPYLPAPAAPPPRERWLTRDEFARLLAGAVQPHVRLFIALALHTGARSGAILGLTWPKVNFGARTIDMGRATGRKGRATVPINDDLLPLLEEARLAATCAAVVEHGGDRVASVKTGFRAACVRAGLSDVTPHVLRHTAATWMAIERVPMRDIAEYLGHSDTRTTERIYAKHHPDHLRAAASALTSKRG